MSSLVISQGQSSVYNPHLIFENEDIVYNFFISVLDESSIKYRDALNLGLVNKVCFKVFSSMDLCRKMNEKFFKYSFGGNNQEVNSLFFIKELFLFDSNLKIFIDYSM